MLHLPSLVMKLTVMIPSTYWLAFLVVGCCGNEITSNRTGWSYTLPDNQEVIYDVLLDQEVSEHVVHKRSGSQLRISLYYDTSVHWLPTDQEILIKEKVEEAAAFWKDTLRVQPTHDPIRLSRKCISNEVRYFNGVKYCRDGCALLTHCGDIVIPNSHLQSCRWWDSVANEYYSTDRMDSDPDGTHRGVVDADFVLYVAAISSDKCQRETTVAYAAHCQLEGVLDRPVAGYISICPHAISTSIHKHEELLYTIKHEILHALGFTASLYAFFRDPMGGPLTPRDQYTGKPLNFDYSLSMYTWSDRVVAQVTRPAWRLKGQTIAKTVNMIVTQNVVREVRNHFNCPTLEGGELEDQGINGTALTHWEKRVFENEFMTGTYTQNPVISRITLALMEDTGWYNINYKNAGILEWGQNLGCDFVMKSCYEWMETRIARNEDIHPFCINVNRGQPLTECTRSRGAVAICNLAEFQASLPLQYQYFRSVAGVQASDTGRYGGSVSLADYCPYLQEFVWKQDDSFKRGSRCSISQNNLEQSQNHLLEYYGPNSKCFSHGLGWQLQHCRGVFKPLSGSGCYQYRCDTRSGLTLIVMGVEHRCYFEGQQILVTYSDSHWLHRGNITCPSCAEICQEEGFQCPPEQRDVYISTDSNAARIPCGKATHHQISQTLIASLLVLCYLCIRRQF